ncbi:MAG: hypothetical protein ACRCYY_07895 [Trueperaceae bacterium]
MTLVLTPTWLWHDHGSESDERAVTYATRKLNGSVLKHGVGTLQPAWEERKLTHPPMSTYKWKDSKRALGTLAQVETSPFDDVALEYVNPYTGGSVMTSFTCHIQMLPSWGSYQSAPLC